jgi:hypothetical protein
LTEAGVGGLPAFVTHAEVPFPVLPSGIHDANDAQVKEAFVEAFADNGRRRQVYEGWNSFRSILRSIVDVEEEYVDGSFVTGKPRPKDIDVSYWIDADELNALAPIKQVALNGLMQGGKAFFVDAYIVPVCPPGHQSESVFQEMQWTHEFWSNCKDSNGVVLPAGSPTKGFLRMLP